MYHPTRPLFDPNTPPGTGTSAQGAAPPAPPPAPAQGATPSAPAPAQPAAPVGLPDEATLRSQAAAMELQQRFSSQESQIKALTDKITQLETARNAAATAAQTAASKPGVTDDDLANDPAMLKLNTVESQIKAVNDALLAMQKQQEESRNAEFARQREYQVAQRRTSETSNITNFFKNQVIPADPDLKADARLQALVGKDLTRLIESIDFSVPDLTPQYNQLQLGLHRSIQENKSLLSISSPGTPDPTTDARGAAEAREAAAASNLSVQGASPTGGTQQPAAKTLQRNLAQRMMDIYQRNGGKL